MPAGQVVQLASKQPSRSVGGPSPPSPSSATTMSDSRVVIVAKVQVKPEKLAAFEPAFAEFMAGVKTEPNCIYFKVAVSEDRLTYWMYEEYTSRKGIEEHEASAHYKKFNATASGESFWSASADVTKNWTPYH